MEENGKEILQEQRTYSTFHSDEVQEIMGRQPAWILRWGITVLILILTGIIVACYFIKYPQTVTAAVTLTSDNPPSDLVAKYTGTLDSVYVSDGASVRKGQLLALVANAANYRDVIWAEAFLADSAAAVPPEEWPRYELGEIQPAWISYIAAMSDYADYTRIDQIGNKKALLAGQVWRAKEYYRKLEAQRETMVKDYELEQASSSRDSILLSRKAISQAEYDNARKAFLAKQNSLAAFDATMASAHLSHLQLEQQILELETQRITEVAEYERRISQARNTLSSQIAQWKEHYAVIAPYDGTVSLQNVWNRGQHVSAGDIIASVSPEGGMVVQGRLKVPSAGFGKVEAGQEVNIKLNGFPFMEYGILKGEVASISKVPENTDAGLCYTVVVSLPKGLESTYRKEFPFVQDMDGSAEIITEDMRLIEQFIRPIRSLFVNR